MIILIVNILAALLGFALFIVCFLGLILWITTPKGPGTTSPGSTSGFWTKHGNDIKALAFIAIALGFINWLCFLISWKWWLANWENRQLFFISQIAIVYAFYTFMFAKKIGAHIFAALVLLTIITGWVTVAKKRLPSEDTVATDNVPAAFQGCLNDGSQISVGPGPYKVPANQWSKWVPVMGKKVRVFSNDPNIANNLTYEYQDVNGNVRSSTTGGNLCDLTAFERIRSSSEEFVYTVESWN